MTEAKTKATELIVQLQEQITSQTVEIESLRALASENEKRAIDYKSEVEALEESRKGKSRRASHKPKTFRQRVKRKCKS